jgi:hypothetical protein
MNSWRIFTLALLLGFGALPSFSPGAQPGIDKIYTFKVYLEDEEIGQQRFVVSSNGTQRTVEIEAQFEVTFWILTAYSYRHTNTEAWNGECLSMIRSQTNDNGKAFFVQGTYKDNGFRLVTQSGSRSVDGCVKTFAYWDPEFLSSRSLLNSQTGEMNEVTVNNLGLEVISVRDRPTPATHYHIDSDKFSIDLWYSSKGEWLALQSTTENDSRLRYVLQ